MTEVRLTINGASVSADVEPRTHLADFLREQRLLTGTHIGCEHGVCGACTVKLDGAPVRSCITFAVACDGAAVQTVEGFEQDEVMADLRAAFTAEHALQCGYCTPGMLITAHDIVTRLPDADDARVREELSGNLCRCTGYQGIVCAIRSVLDTRAGAAAGSPQPARPPVRVMGPPAPETPGARAEAPADDGDGTHIRQSFAVPFPPGKVWSLFGDVPAVAACMPGAVLDSVSPDGRIEGHLTVRLGPIRAAFAGKATQERDEAQLTGRINRRRRRQPLRLERPGHGDLQARRDRRRGWHPGRRHALLHAHRQPRPVHPLGPGAGSGRPDDRGLRAKPRGPAVRPCARWCGRRVACGQPAALGAVAADTAVPANGVGVMRLGWIPCAVLVLLSAPVLAAKQCPQVEPADMPFFDSIAQAEPDPTPPPPELGPIDRAVLDFCGDWGSAIDRDAGRQWFLDLLDKFPDLGRDLFGELRRADPRRYRAPTSPAFREDVARLWFDEDAFRHIVCGEPDHTDRDGCPQLGGFHYAPRYLQAQEKGWAGPLPVAAVQAPGWCPARPWGIAEGVHAMPVWFRHPGGIGLKCITGYAHGQDAAGILLAATRGAVEALRKFGKREQIGCDFAVPARPSSFWARIVMRSGAILTYYPVLDSGRSGTHCP